MTKMDVKGAYAHLEFLIPARGLIGLRNRLMSATQGEAIMHHNFHDYRPLKGDIPSRGNGVMVSMARGPAVAFSLDNLQQRGTMFVQPGDDIYVGMIIAENARGDDMAVNPCKEKKLTNMRASGSDKNILLKPPRLLTLEIALEYIEADELVEITPSKIRLRKKVLSEEGRNASSAAARRSASMRSHKDPHRSCREPVAATPRSHALEPRSTSTGGRAFTRQRGNDVDMASISGQYWAHPDLSYHQVIY